MSVSALLVFWQEQAVECASGKSGESIIGGGENSEGTFAFERINQLSGLYRGYKGCKAAICDSGVYDILEHRAQGWR